MNLITGLNPQQQQAVMAGLGPVLVLAGPGSGKTRVLTHRIAYLLDSMGVRPYQILAVTFTNKAAREMESRLVGLLEGRPVEDLTLRPQRQNGASLPDETPPPVEDLTLRPALPDVRQARPQRQTEMPLMGTFHAACARILRREASSLPFQSNFVIYDSDDQLDLVKNAIKDLNLDEKLYRPPGVHAAISNAKNELLLPDDYPVQNYRDEVVSRIYRRYQELLLASNALDFDDLLLWTAYLLEREPAVRDKYARRYEHVLVDEFQDTNMAQYVLLKHLASVHHNLYVVGDVDQSIYGWRGADYRNVLRFERDYPDAQVILLEQNYRSTQNILDAAMGVIDRNPHRTPRRLFTDRGEGQKIILYEAYDDRAEGAFVVDTITSLVVSKRAQPGDFAVMYRTNAQSRVLEESFLHAKLPYKLVGAQRFYGRREIKDIIAYLRLVHNPNDEVSLTRVINTPPRGVGNKTVLALRTQAQRLKKSPGVLLLELGQAPNAPDLDVLPGRMAGPLANFGRLLAGWRDYAITATPLSLMDRVLSDINYQSYLDDGTDEGHDRWENVMELRRLAAEFQQAGLEAFLEQVALVSDQDTLDARANVPTLLTLHAAKGLEFPVVFIVGINDGSLPHSRSFDDPDGMQEERRLFYVGITRAKDRLYLVYSQNRSLYGYSEPIEPSRFLEDIPAHLIDEMQPVRSGGRTYRRAYQEERWQAPQATRVSPSQPRFHPGLRVMHNVWGEGMVLNSRIQDDDEIVDIFFENVGLKRVAASLAKLDVIEK